MLSKEGRRESQRNTICPMLVARRKPAKKQADRETESAAAEDRGGGRARFPLEMVDQVERMVRSFGFFRSGVLNLQGADILLIGPERQSTRERLTASIRELTIASGTGEARKRP